MDKSLIPFNTQSKPAKAHPALRALLRSSSALEDAKLCIFYATVTKATRGLSQKENFELTDSKIWRGKANQSLNENKIKLCRKHRKILGSSEYCP